MLCTDSLVTALHPLPGSGMQAVFCKPIIERLVYDYRRGDSYSFLRYLC